MAIHFITGKPGGGKTLYSVQLIVEELLVGSRHIITNVPLRLDMLNEYIQSLTDRDCRVIQRVRLMSDEETGRFFCLRPHMTIDFIPKDDWQEERKDFKFPAYSQAAGDGGVLYVIDEVQNFFSARRWAKTGPHVLYYQSQHRKLGDTVVLITQAAQLVETQFRAIAEDFCEIKNWSKLRVSYLTMPRVFLRQLRASCSPGALVLEHKWKRLNPKLAECFDTAAGVGIHGRCADKGEKAKGVPWWVALLVLGVVAYFGCRFAAALFVHQFTIPRLASSSVRAAPAPGPAAPVFQPQPGSFNGASTSLAHVVRTNAPHVTGYMKVGDRLRVCLSDGRMLAYQYSPELVQYLERVCTK